MPQQLSTFPAGLLNPRKLDCKNKQRVKYSFFEITVLLHKYFYYATLAIIYAHIISIEIYIKQQRTDLLVIIVAAAVHTLIYTENVYRIYCFYDVGTYAEQNKIIYKLV